MKGVLKYRYSLLVMILEHTEEQVAILNQISSFRVLAAAGSGKTSTMAYYVKGELDSGRCKEQEICFITFTRFAAKQIRDRVSKILNRMAQLTYGTFHATMWKLMIKAGIIRNDEKGLFDACIDKGVLRFISNMRTREPRLVAILKTYKLLIVDEFQDLDETQFEFVSLFKTIQPNLRIVAIGDLAQNIYRFRGTSNEFLRTKLLEIEPNLASYRLTTNFRSTPAILNFVNALFSYEIQNEHILPMFAPIGKGYGTKPKFYEYAKNPGKGIGEYEELVVETLIPILMKAKQEGQSVALIFPVLKCVSYNYIGALLFEKSKERGFTPDFHQITKEDETCATVEFQYNPSEKNSPIQKSTIHSSKGLEWDIVAS
jgi:superfamily I DNA/RNA helicase